MNQALQKSLREQKAAEGRPTQDAVFQKALTGLTMLKIATRYRPVGPY